MAPPMSRCSKLLTKARRSPKNFAFNNICKLAECHGFVLDRQSGPHMIYENPAYPAVLMNFPKGLSGISASLPFAIWFYLAIEQLPLAAEESHDPKRDMPRGLLWGIATLILASILTPFPNSGYAPGAAVLGSSA